MRYKNKTFCLGTWKKTSYADAFNKSLIFRSNILKVIAILNLVFHFLSKIVFDFECLEENGWE